MIRLRAVLISTAVLALLFTGSYWLAAPSRAVPVSGCQDDFWFVAFHSTRRTICDGPIMANGSWYRVREFYTPAHNVPFTCSTYGGPYYSTTSCSGGYFQQRTSSGIESYVVFPDNVLGDEPGHLVNGMIA